MIRASPGTARLLQKFRMRGAVTLRPDGLGMSAGGRGSGESPRGHRSSHGPFRLNLNYELLRLEGERGHVP
jgi:hypothetical protein